MDIHHAISNDYEAKIIGTIPYNNIHKSLNINKNEYIRLVNPFMFYDSIVFLHERKFLIFFWLLNKFLFQKIRIIYIHHNIFYNHITTTILPNTIVSISDKITDNLIQVFKAKKENIHKIYNCVQDIHPEKHKSCSKNKIRIIYPARINSVKRQIEVYNHLQGKINKHIEILFVGTGPLYNELKKAVKDTAQFKVLGFRDDIYKLLQESDYIMLFSKHEGLPITLIEATMCGTPIICNDVGGNCEIAHDKENAFVVNDWDSLINILNKIPLIDEEEYMSMSQKSRYVYEKNFTFEKFKANYLQLLKQINND